jgi:methyltransferase (TIGR00027 family)
MRALANDGLCSAQGFEDTIAVRLLPPWWAALHQVLRRALLRADPRVRARAAGELDAVALRSLELDRHLLAAIDRGTPQVVILGAGLDTRAFRLEALQRTTLFEVDQPRTQRHKREVTTGLRPLAGTLHSVAVDFEHDSLTHALALAGHRADLPTVWLWEGVVMYLTDAALRATLAAVVAASAPGSELVLHYHEPVEQGPQAWAMDAVLSVWREPQVGQRRREVMAAAVGAAGLVLVVDSGQADWARRFGAQQTDSPIARQSRLLVARRPG